MRAKTVKANWSLRTKKFGLPSVFILCIFFFLAGFFGSSFFYHSQEDEYSVRARLLEKSTKEETEHRLMNVGESGDNFITSIPFQVLSWNPRALYFPNFASAKQCESIIEMAKAELTPSRLMLREGETEEATTGIRTSSGMFISASEDKTGLLQVIDEKIARATKIPRTHGEAYNILRYKVGQKYYPHYDAFNPAEYGPQESQRVASFLLYLTDVSEGGETTFPFENGSNMDGSYNFKDCIGLKINPRKGDGLLFYSLFPNGTIDRVRERLKGIVIGNGKSVGLDSLHIKRSLHGSCPVIKGEKWVATKWIREQLHYDD